MRRKELLALVDAYIAVNFTGEEIVAEKIFEESVSYAPIHDEPPPQMLGLMVPAFFIDDIDKILAEEESNETFSEMLLRLIKESGKKPSQIYNAADVQRQIYKRIKDNKDYKPSKDTVITFAIALKLDLPTTKKFLETAGFALSKAVKRDVIISCFIENKIFSVIKLNEILHEYGQNVLFKRE